MTVSNSLPDDDLLLAVRYVLNECDPSELVAFEARLAEDFAAQSALVEAVRIVGLLQATPTCGAVQPLPNRVAPRQSQSSWKLASLVAATLLVAVVLSWRSLPSSHNPQSVALQAPSPALVQAWSALDLPPVAVEDADEASTIHDSDLHDSDDVAGDVPDWLLTAVLVEAEQGAMDDTEMGSEEETQL